MEQKNYTLKECRAFAQRQLETTNAFIRGNYNPEGESTVLVIQDEAHPWNILHSVIGQFYKRECAMAQSISIARCQLNHANELMNRSNEWDNAYWQMQKAIGELTKENERLKAEAEQPALQTNEVEQPEALQELLQEASPTEWIGNMGEILDSIIMAIDYSGSDGLTDSLRNARSLQRFFMELGRELN